VNVRETAASFDVELRREQSYDTRDLLPYVQSHSLTLTREQKVVYELIMKHVSDKFGGIFFLDAPRGTGKTFLLKLILAAIRSNNDIALALASS
jgi:tRNA(Met) C34 N-acetyltransferase TmcA